MPNLMLTNWCNYKCPYCFGVDKMVPKIKAQSMSDEVFLGILNWLEKTHYRQSIHIMGGEPTLHPKFDWIVKTVIDKKLPVLIFSNLATEKAPEYAKMFKDKPARWVVNVNPPRKWNKEQKENIETSLKLLGKAAAITFNIMPDEDDNDWAIDLIRKFNLDTRIKVGFVLPTYTQSNYALDDSEYKVVANKVVELALKADQYGISLDYECGVPICAFTEEQLGILWKCNSQVSSGCFSRLDFSPIGEVFYCLPLATVASKKYYEFENYNEARKWFEDKYSPYRRLGRTINCATCNLMNPNQCNGACLAKNLIGVKNLKL